VGEDEAMLDKRPVRRKKTTRKKRGKKAPVKAKTDFRAEESFKETVLVGNPQIEHLEEDPIEAPGSVTFFSKYKLDEIVISTAETIQLASNKWYTKPSVVLRFNDHKFTTADQEVIEYIRNPRGLVEMFDRYEIEVFEVGKPEHEKQIHRLSDAGIREYLMELHMGARQIAKAEGFSYEAAV
jgi:hypothetical protein